MMNDSQSASSVSRASSTLRFAQYMARHNVNGVLEHLVSRLAELRPQDPLTQMHNDLGTLLRVEQSALAGGQETNVLQGDGSAVLKKEDTAKMAGQVVEEQQEPQPSGDEKPQHVVVLAKLEETVRELQRELEKENHALGAFLLEQVEEQLKTNGEDRCSQLERAKGSVESVQERVQSLLTSLKMETAVVSPSVVAQESAAGLSSESAAGLSFSDGNGKRNTLQEKIFFALRRLAWRIGGEHKLYEHLKDDAGFVSEASLSTRLDDSDEVTGAEAFAWLDSKREGKVSEEELDARVIHQLFAQQFFLVTGKCGQAALKSMAQRIPRAKRGKPAVHCLAEMSDEEMREYATGVQPALLACLTELREQIRTANKQNTRTTGGSAKFAFKAADKGGKSFLFGTLKMFKQGLEKLIGIPASNVTNAMQREHQSQERFTTGNYGVSTFDRQEYDLVAKNAAVDYEFDGSRVRRDVDGLMQAFDHGNDDVLKSLTREEVVGLVLYTGPMFERYNQVLRRVLFPIAQRLQAGEEVEVDVSSVDYVTTIHMIVSGVLKLMERTSLVDGRKVYRGLKGKLLPEPFTRPDKNGCRGGTELGFMSTTTNINVAKQYAEVESGQWPMIFEIETGQVDRGASLEMLSQYPGEAEVLLPPLCYLEVTGDPQVVWQGGFAYWLVPMRVNVNLRSSTREQHEERRKLEVMGTASSMLLDTKEALRAALHSPDKTNPNAGTELFESLLGEATALLRRMRELEGSWFNDDLNFGTAMQDLVDVRSYSLETMRAFVYGDVRHTSGYFTQYSIAMWHRLKVGDARAAYAAEKGGDGSGLAAAATKLAVLEGYMAEGKPDSKSGLDGETALMRAAAAGDEARMGLLADAKCDLNAANARHCTALLAAVAAGQDRAVKKLLDLGAENKGKVDTEETPLHQAAEHGRVECVKVLIAWGAAVNVVDCVNGANPLREACASGFVECARLLAGAGADIHAADNNGAHPIHVAAMYGHLGCVEWLKEMGADFHAVTNDGSQAIHLAAMGGHVGCVELLKEAGADVHAVDGDGDRPMHVAAARGHVGCMKLLEEAGADIHAVNNHGNHVIHSAAFGGHVGCMEWLKEAGADIYAVNEYGDHPMHAAASGGHVGCMEWLKEMGADIHAANNNGAHSIHEAAAGGHVCCVEWLKEAGADVHAADGDGDRPIHAAAFGGHVGCMEWLKEAGADIDAVNNHGNHVIHAASRAGHVGCMEWLKDAGADIDAVNNDGAHSIHEAAAGGHVGCVEWLKEAGVDIHAVNKYGDQAIHAAAWSGHVGCMAYLKDAGADIDAVNNKGARPIHVAAARGHVGCVEWLKKAGADIHAVNKFGARSIHEAAVGEHVGCMEYLKDAGADIDAVTNDGSRPIHAAARARHVECVEWLKKAGADIHAATHTGSRPIHAAAWSGHVGCMAYLKDAGADIDAVTNDGSRPIHEAAWGGHVGCVMMLKEAGADIHAANNKGNRPIHEAAAGGHVGCTEYLKDAGADIEAVNNDGSRPIHSAAWAGHVGCVMMLKDAGADINAPDKNRMCPAQVADCNGHLECVKVLRVPAAGEQ